MFDKITESKTQLMLVAPDYTILIAGILFLFFGAMGLVRLFSFAGFPVNVVGSKDNLLKNKKSVFFFFTAFRFLIPLFFRSFLIILGWQLIVTADEQANKNIDDQKIIELKASGVLNEGVIDRILKQNYITGESSITFSKLKDAIADNKTSVQFERRILISKIKKPSELEAIESQEQKELRNKLMGE